MGDNSISKIYQFLSKQSDWKTDADINNDGIITKFEAFCYLNDNSKDWNGEGSNTKDLIYKFWNSIDTDTTGKVKAGSKLSDKYALNDEEMANFERNVKISEKVDTFMKSVTVPDIINQIGKKSDWINEVKDAILEKAFKEAAKNGGDITDAKLQEFFEQTYRQATVRFYSAELIKDIKVKDAKDKDLYFGNDDKELTKIINSYVESLEGDTTTSIEAIIAKVKELIEAYKDTANTNSQTGKIEEYNYNSGGLLNDLQKATLTRDITAKIVSYLQTNYSDIYTGESYISLADPVIQTYVEKYLSDSDKKASDFVSLKNFDISKIDINQLVADIKSAQAGTRSADSTLSNNQMNLEESDKTFNGYTMSFIFANVNKNAIQLSGFQTWNNAKTTAKNSIKSYVNNIKTALSGSGYDASKLEKAAQNTILYYTAILDQIQDQISSSGDGMKEVIFSYVDADGRSHTESSTFSQKTRHREKDAGRTNEGALDIDQSSSGIRMNESYAGTNTYEFYLNSAVLLRKFQEFFNCIA